MSDKYLIYNVEEFDELVKTRNRKLLYHAFVWESSTEGHDFWKRRSRRVWKLSIEDIESLQTQRNISYMMEGTKNQELVIYQVVFN